MFELFLLRVGKFVCFILFINKQTVLPAAASNNLYGFDSWAFSIQAGPAPRGARGAWPPQSTCLAPPPNKQVFSIEDSGSCAKFQTLAPLNRLLWRRLCIQGKAVYVVGW